MALRSEKLPKINVSRNDYSTRNRKFMSKSYGVTDIKKKCELLSNLFKNKQPDCIIEEFNTPPTTSRDQEEKPKAKTQQLYHQPSNQVFMPIHLNLNITGEMKPIELKNHIFSKLAVKRKKLSITEMDDFGVQGSFYSSGRRTNSVDVVAEGRISVTTLARECTQSENTSAVTTANAAEVIRAEAIQSPLEVRQMRTHSCDKADTEVRRIVMKQKKRVAVRPSIFDEEKRAKFEVEVLHKIKQVVFSEFNNLIMATNGIKTTPGSHTYKFFLGKGNNQQMIKTLIMSRVSWMRTRTKEEANFVWTQGRFVGLFQCMESVKNGKLRPILWTPINYRALRLSRPPVTKQRYRHELRKTGTQLITDSPSFTAVGWDLQGPASDIMMVNKLEYNVHLASKGNLFHNMKAYYDALGIDAFTVLPLTFHVLKNDQNESFMNFSKHFQSVKGGVWIVKPAQNSNRGCGINVYDSFQQIKDKVQQGSARSYIVQKYIENPLLIHNRKFDIRWFALITSINGHRQGYFYKEGYLRTSSKEFSLSNINNKFIHLTNDAIQVRSSEYGKHESGNKLGYAEFKNYLKIYHPGTSFKKDIYPQIRSTVTDTIRATHTKLDPNGRAHSFEVFGYDFMVDDDFKVWLIEWNTNPWLDTSCAHLQRIIPTMIDNAFRIVLDPVFPHAKRPEQNKLFDNNFELIFNDVVDKEVYVPEIPENLIENEGDDDEEFP